MSSQEGKSEKFQTMKNEFINVFATEKLKSCVPAHGGHAVWHVFNQSNQWELHFEYYLHGTDSLWGNYAAIFNGGSDSAKNRKKYSSNHQLLMDNSQMGLRVKTLSLKSYSVMVKLPYVSRWDRRSLCQKLLQLESCREIRKLLRIWTEVLKSVFRDLKA